MSSFSKYSFFCISLVSSSILTICAPVFAGEDGSGDDCGGVPPETRISPRVCWGSNNNGDLVCTCTSPNGGFTWQFGPYRTVEECEARGKELGCESVSTEMADKDAGNVCELAESIVDSEGEGELPDCPPECGAQATASGTTRYHDSNGDPVIGDPSPNDFESVNCCWAYKIISCVGREKKAERIKDTTQDAGGFESLFNDDFLSLMSALDD